MQPQEILIKSSKKMHGCSNLSIYSTIVLFKVVMENPNMGIYTRSLKRAK